MGVSKHLPGALHMQGRHGCWVMERHSAPAAPASPPPCKQPLASCAPISTRCASPSCVQIMNLIAGKVALDRIQGFMEVGAPLSSLVAPTTRLPRARSSARTAYYLLAVCLQQPLY